MDAFVEKLVDGLNEELECETVFSIPLGNGHSIPVFDSVVVTWIIIAALIVISKLLVRNLTIDNVSKKQLALESGIGFLRNFFEDALGEHGVRYMPYLMTVILYIGVANVIGLFGFKPPTKDMNVTIALSLMSIILIEYAGIHKKGVKGWIKGFAQPVAIVAPINVLEIFIRPLSLCMRLFGNVLGAFVVMELIKLCIPVGVPTVFSLYFDIFDGLIQAYVFVFLTSLFINEATE